jgi:hypothetical protein
VCRGRQKNKAGIGTDTPYRRRGFNRRELTDSGNYLFLNFNLILQNVFGKYSGCPGSSGRAGKRGKSIFRTAHNNTIIIY